MNNQDFQPVLYLPPRAAPTNTVCLLVYGIAAGILPAHTPHTTAGRSGRGFFQEVPSARSLLMRSGGAVLLEDTVRLEGAETTEVDAGNFQGTVQLYLQVPLPGAPPTYA